MRVRRKPMSQDCDSTATTLRPLSASGSLAWEAFGSLRMTRTGTGVRV